MMKEKICPYPGLRPFTQEESIFFKGRDLHIRQVINQLEERKFVMITGASGDGKSSLVYAGVIPNASAGFFHAEYNNWLFVDFRPERAPLQNLANVLSEKLEIKKEEVEDKLQYGFSSIINLYKSTDFYIDKEGEKWNSADNIEKKHLKNKAANLFILADQFEEFFTNQENFNNGKPSVDAYTTVNLLLETAKIAISEKLPVYVVFTMRSDFISQCVAFKNLPEFIGFSQFFIPRLKRNELQQVIEEPALLSGGKITTRLVEILINELRDGFDQLPVLQHNLNALWRLADNGNTEIDLIHLVKLGGMSSRFLNNDDKKLFDKWFTDLNDYKKEFLENPSLANVLNSHANELYLTAYNYFQKNNKWADKNITEDDAQFIIKKSFQCLTKIDEGRAVRNRMTLAEITRIINKPHITTDIVCGVMNIFRLPSSTFIRPFIDVNDVATEYLSIDSIWDITHEALIRNWELLKSWEDEEYQILANFKDFNTQLNRWSENGMSDNFLLAAGNLAHFQDWYKRSNLNPFWIAKYDNSDVSAQKRLEKSRELSQDTELFLTNSRNYLDKIEKLKKLRRRFAFVAALFVIVILSGFTFWALSEKSEAEEQRKIALEETIKAEEAKQKADENANEAQIAKNQSDSARAVAEQMRLLAEEKTFLAITESQRALREKNRADQQLLISEELRKNAEEQKNIAETQKTKAEQQKLLAEQATKEAQTLSYLAIAQSLTFKAEQIYTDNQINLFLAELAYEINNENSGSEYDAAIFEALNFALENSGYNRNVFASEKTFTSIKLEDDNILKYLTADGYYTNYDLNNSRLIQSKLLKFDIPVNQSFIFENKILISLEDNSLQLYDIYKDETSKFKGHSDFVRAAVLSESKNILVTGSRDKTIKIWDLSLKRNNETASFDCNDKVMEMVISSDESIVYGILANGEIFKITLSDNILTTIANSYQMNTCIRITNDNKALIIGTLTGQIKIINLTENTVDELEVTKSKIETIATDKNSELLTISTANKSVYIYQLNDKIAKPFILNNLSKKITELSFNSEGVLFGISEDNKIFKWQTSNKTLSDEVLNHLTRNLTTEEWQKFVGDDVEYQTIK